MRARYIIRQCSASRRAVGSWGASLAAAAKTGVRALLEAWAGHTLCPSSVPLKAMLSLHIIDAQRDSGSLQHTSSQVASRTEIIAVVWRRKKLYIARLDKILRLTQAELLPDEAFASGNPQGRRLALKHLCCHQQGSSLPACTQTPRRPGLQAPQGGQFFIQ